MKREPVHPGSVTARRSHNQRRFLAKEQMKKKAAKGKYCQKNKELQTCDTDPGRHTVGQSIPAEFGISTG